jgi:hypothetical protein
MALLPSTGHHALDVRDARSIVVVDPRIDADVPASRRVSSSGAAAGRYVFWDHLPIPGSRNQYTPKSSHDLRNVEADRRFLRRSAQRGR